MKTHAVSQFFGGISLWAKKNSPQLLTAGSIITSAVAIGMGIFATTKLNNVLAPYNKKIDELKADLKDDNKIQNKIVNVNELKKELALTYAKAVGRVTLLYSPTIILFGTSVGCALGSHNIMKQRNLALGAALATLERTYSACRKRVQEKYGEDEEEKIHKNMIDKKVEEIDPKTGKSKSKTISVPALTNKDGEPWCVLYDCGNAHWEPDARLNFDYLMMVQDYLNEKLIRQGYLFLNDVWEQLGFTTNMIGVDKMRASRILGWIYDPKNPKRSNCVHFGLTQLNTRVCLPEIEAQISRNEPAFWLNLNVDGDILSGEHGNEVFANFARHGGVESGNY